MPRRTVIASRTRNFCLVFLVWALAPAVFAQARDPNVEFDEIAGLLALTAGSVVADVGAGAGEWSVRLAQRVGPRGKVHATEVVPIQVESVRRMAAARRLLNVEAVLSTQDDVTLPSSCCDAMLLRLVYHAFDNPAKMRDGIRQAMKPGGLVLIIDFRPLVDTLASEMKTAGFEHVRSIASWQGQDGVYAMLFRRNP